MTRAIHVAAALSLATIACAREHVERPNTPTADASLAVADAEAPPLAQDAAVSAEETEPRIVWDWRGTYTFVESCEGGCPRYRIVIGECPGPCRVHIDVDGPKTKLRLEGVGRGTVNEQLEVRFTADRPDAPSRGFVAGAVLFTLEAAPGDHMVLRFGQLEATNKASTIIARHPPLRRATR
jgi:hypothetical protein